ncbi:MAG: hypothetical protein GQ525_15610 [Draconibacterium sp.]|nr:hypothetical protein [Draconibacterium sp.]
MINHNNYRKNKFIEQLILNGTQLEKPFFSHTDLMQGGKLEFFMCDKLSTEINR